MHRPHCAAPSSPPRSAFSFAALYAASLYSVRIDDRAQHDAAFLGAVVAGAAVHRRALVPHQHVADPPAMVVDEAVLRRVLGQFLDQRPGFFRAMPTKP